MSLLLTALEKKLPETRPHPLALLPPKPQKRFPPHFHRPGPKANTFPLREVAGCEGPTWIHVPFSISDMSQIEEKLGSFSKNLTRYRKEFLRLTQTEMIFITS